MAGERHGVVYEHELSLGQGFKNHYESTKFQAELWVHEMMDRVPTTIYRPAIVVGDSRDGRDAEVRRAVLHAAHDRGVGGAPARRSRSSARRARRSTWCRSTSWSTRWQRCPPEPAAEGETLHLVDPDPISARELLTALSREYAGKDPGYKVPPRLIESSLRFKTVRDMFSGAPQESIRYLNHEVRFDTRRADDLLAPRRPSLPALRGVRRADGALLPRARGRRGVRAGGRQQPACLRSRSLRIGMPSQSRSCTAPSGSQPAAA